MKSRGLRGRLAVAFVGAIAAAMLLFGSVVVLVVAYNEADEVAENPQQEEESENSVARVLVAMAFAAPPVVALAVAVGLWLSRRALAPMREASERARAARASDLNLSLPVGGSGDEWDELAKTLNTLLADARASIDRIRQFTADAAHELKTPLTAIIGVSEVAIRKDRTAGEYRAALEEVRAESVRLARMVDALLTLARSDGGTLLTRRHPVDVLQLAREAIRRVQPLGDVQLAGATAWVDGDATLLAQIFDNLLQNAFRHGKAPVALRLYQTALEVMVELSDSGPGVAAELSEKMFERFTRASGAREGDGHGLGLSIARAVAVAHGGSLVWELPGSTFRLRLPAAKAAPELA